MTPEHPRDSEAGNGTVPGPEDGIRRDPRPTRRGVLLGVGLAGIGGALAGCSTSAVPYGANEAGAVPGAQPQGGMATSGAMSSPGGAMSSPGGAMSSPGGGMQASPAQPPAKAAGTVLGAASEIPVGG